MTPSRGQHVVGGGRWGARDRHPAALKLDDTVPFRLSRNHFMIEKRDGSYYVRIIAPEMIADGLAVDDRSKRHCERERMK